MSTKIRHPRVLVSRSEDLQAKVSRSLPEIHRRLLAGARKIVVDTGAETITLTDSDFADAGQDWTLRVSGSSIVRIHRTNPLPRNASRPMARSSKSLVT